MICASYETFLAYEAQARNCLEFQPLLIPGQLQTEPYARAVTEQSFLALGPDQVDDLVEVRMQRQKRLCGDSPLVLDAVVTEAALRLQVGGPEVMRAQLRHLRRVFELPNVTFRVIPYTAGARAAITGAFTLFASGENLSDAAAFTEAADNTTAFRDEALVLRRLNRLFKNLSRAALSAQDSCELLERIEKELV
ncbi:DUF5753 domain-containing protein [Streptomyces radicis]|uniref:XRE family transcriptional regulator n=1 Tax=Streptomyces radicis TaxID=1750517 RepID=A0A3A9W8A0_9ACTN|nr:DUF5753 domain-containing protein [Streptomyces radicis]RKN09090.1 XRE family transcriptional regulator [Streptomyces radicis]RKN22719.1 XRE family transcriptional regulator [Streptomyces radicis]